MDEQDLKLESAPSSEETVPLDAAVSDVAPLSAPIVASPPAVESGRLPVGRQDGDARSFVIRRGRGGRGRERGSGRGGPGRPDDRRGGEAQAQSDYEEKNLEVARVTRVTKGGKRMRFRVLTVIGNRKGRVGFGIGKGSDVAGATAKATAQARKNLMTVPQAHDTIPHETRAKFSASLVLIKPAPKGSGIKAGGAVRQVLELAGVQNVVSKILGSSNKINNVKATFLALRKLKAPPKKEAPQAEKT